MSAHPHVVAADTVFLWDHVPTRLGRGTIIDVPPGSPLQAAIGADKLIPLYGAPPVTVPLASEPAPESVPEPAVTAPEPVQEEAPEPAPEPVREPAQEKAAEPAPAPRSPARAAAAAAKDPPDAGGDDI